MSTMRLFVFGFGLSSILLGGCASQLVMTYRSVPEGAVLYDGEKALGYTPMTVYYLPTPDLKNGGCMQLRGVAVRWVSGASASVPGVMACAAQTFNQEMVFNRPNGVAGAEADHLFALELERNSILRQQAAAADRAAFLQTLSAIQLQNRAAQPTRCNSTVVGNQVQTTCDK